MKLYYSPYSTCSRRVLMTASLLGIHLELVSIDLAKREQRQPAFLGRNPMGRVPVLEDGDFLLPESHAIMIYLADKKPDTTLYPVDLRLRADVNRWLFWGASHWSPAIFALNFENMLKKVLAIGEPDPVQVQRQEGYLRECAKVLDEHLGSVSRQWVCGATMTIADLAIVCSLTYAESAKLPIKDFRNVERWFERLKTLDAWRATEPPPMRSAA